MADPYRSNGSAAYDVRRRNTAQPAGQQPERLPDAPARHELPASIVREQPYRRVKAQNHCCTVYTRQRTSTLSDAHDSGDLQLCAASTRRSSNVARLKRSSATLKEQQARLQT